MNPIALCRLPMLPMREEPKHSSQMINMLLFGEVYEILESNENSWHKVRGIHDNYEGWMYYRKPDEVSAEFLQAYKTETPVYASAEINYIVVNNSRMLISPGSRLPLLNGNTFYMGNEAIHYQDEMLEASIDNEIIETARKFINTPYLWGGRSILGIDCSGLSQVVMAMCRTNIARDAWQQQQQGKTVNSLEEAEEGDLIFFAENGDKITHVGIYSGEGTIIHASERVREDKIDEKGIFNEDLKKYTLKHVSIKRFID